MVIPGLDRVSPPAAPSWTSAREKRSTVSYRPDGTPVLGVSAVERAVRALVASVPAGALLGVGIPAPVWPSALAVPIGFAPRPVARGAGSRQANLRARPKLAQGARPRAFARNAPDSEGAG